MLNFELIKGRLQRFTTTSLIENILAILDQAQREDKKSYPFWNLLVLTKWVLLHTKNSPFRQKATILDINATLSLIEKMESDRKVVDFKLGIARGLRIIGYQQFWFQDEATNYTFLRQLVIYVKLRSAFDINTEFKNKTGFEVTQFIRCCYFTLMYLNLDKLGKGYTYDGIIHKDYFNVLYNKFAPKTLNSFVKLLTLEDAEKLKSLQRLGDEVLQLYEANFWLTKPFIVFKNQHRILHRSIFHQTAKHFIYNFLKANCERFTTDFGQRLKKYLELGLQETDVLFFNEDALKEKYSLSKVSDFLIDGNILVECKAIELHPRSGVLRTHDILSKEFESSIIKAYKQLLSTVNKIDKNQVWYGLIVTYKETFIGFGKDAWEDFLKNQIEVFVTEENITLSVLPPKNLIFIDIESWDHIIQVVKDRRASFKEILDKLISLHASDNPHEIILLPEQGLRVQFPVTNFNLSFLEEVHNLVDLE